MPVNFQSSISPLLSQPINRTPVFPGLQGPSALADNPAMDSVLHDLSSFGQEDVGKLQSEKNDIDGAKADLIKALLSGKGSPEQDADLIKDIRELNAESKELGHEIKDASGGDDLIGDAMQKIQHAEQTAAPESSAIDDSDDADDADDADPMSAIAGDFAKLKSDMAKVHGPKSGEMNQEVGALGQQIQDAMQDHGPHFHIGTVMEPRMAGLEAASVAGDSAVAQGVKSGVAAAVEAAG